VAGAAFANKFANAFGELWVVESGVFELKLTECQKNREKEMKVAISSQPRWEL